MRLAYLVLYTSVLAALAATPAIAADAQPWTLQSAIGNPQNFSVSGSFRARIEALDGQFRPGLDDGDNLILLRTTLAAEYHESSFRIGAELFDSRAYFDDHNSSVSTSEVNTFELVQGYVGGSFGEVLGAGSETSVTAGRFTLDLGSRRLVARNDFRNTTNAFTGIHFDWRGSAKEQLTLFYTLPQLRLPSGREAVLGNAIEFDHEGSELRFWGGFFSAPKLVPGTTVELYFYGLNENDSEGRPTRNRHLYTPGTRLYHSSDPGEFDYELEGAYQFGDARTGTANNAAKQDVSAYFVHVQVGRTFKIVWSPRIAVGYDRDSGDHSKSASINRFDTLFGARRFDFGPTSIYGPLARTNLSSPEARLEVKPDARWDGLVAYRAAWLDSSTDSFSNTGVRDVSGRSGTFAGHQIETRVRYWLVPKRIRLDSGGAVFFNARFLDEAPNRAGNGNTLYGYFSVTTSF